MKSAWWVTVSALLLGCAPGDDELASETLPAIQQELQEAQPFRLAPASRVVIGVRGEWIENAEGEAELPIVAGDITLGADDSGHIAIVDLALAFDDVDVGDQALAPEGATLTDLRIELGEPFSVDAQWTEAEVRAHGELDVVFAWALGLSAGSSPLATQSIDDLPFELQVRLDDEGALRAELGIAHEGVIWSLDRYLEVTRVALELHGIL